MATWYTDNINGNDTTGNGTIATPYKTINKAVTVAANNDTINVAGSDFTAVTGILNPSSLGSNTLSTSVDMTATMPVGTIFTVNDPVWGSRKVFFKVQTITATTMTVNTGWWLSSPGAPVGGIEKLTNVHYSTATANVNQDDLITLNKTGISIQAGWTNNFTAQDGITAFSYTGSGLSGTALRCTNNFMFGMTVNNLLFANVTGLSGLTGSTGANTIKYGNMYTTGGTFQVSIPEAAPTGANFYLNHTAFSSFGTSMPSGTTFNIENMYVAAQIIIGSNEFFQFTINNLYAKAATTSVNLTGILDRMSFDINNLYIAWSQLASADQAFTLFRNQDGWAIVRNIVNQGNFGGAGKRPIWLRQAAIAQVQIIAPTINVDTLGIQATAGIQNYHFHNSFQPIIDIEGEKQYYGAGGIIYADPTVYETGTNSLRVNKAAYPSSFVPIKDFYISSSTAKTISIRFKASAAGTVNFSIMPNGKLNTTLTYTGLYVQAKSVTTNWTTVTYTIDAALAARLVDSYVIFNIVPENWAGQYVWIDSVTIA